MEPINRTVTCEYLGRVAYTDGVSVQNRRAGELRLGRGETDGYLLLLEHDPVITDGRFGRGGNLLYPEAEIKERGVGIYRTGRGGDVTYHGPGQLVAYPVIDLRAFGLGARAYVRALEETIILTLGDFGIRGERREGFPGVWVGERKAASIGVAVRNGITLHGTALNVNTDLSYFSLIVPCGLEGVSVTSMKELTGAELGITDVAARYACNFGKVFGSRIVFAEASSRAALFNSYKNIVSL